MKNEKQKKYSIIVTSTDCTVIKAGKNRRQSQNS